MASQATGGVGDDPGAASNPSDAAARPTFGTGVNAYVNMHTRTPDELVRAARARFDTYRRYSYPASATRHGSHAVALTDYINIEYTLLDGRQHYLSGQFQVFKVRHRLGIGEVWTTEYELLRTGTESLPGMEAITTQRTVAPAAATGTRDGGGNLTVETG